MRQSELFTKTRKSAPKDEVAKNAQLLIRAGYINKEMAGVYDYLPLGLRVLNNIMNIIREEMNAIGGQEVLMSSLQRRELWEKTGRWDDEVIDVWFKANLKQDSEADGARSKEVGFAPTHEEPFTNMMEQFVPSYKDLPKYVYQFQTKFRNERRAKSGIMRTREFVMKDMYSFCRTEEEHRAFYERAKQAYINIFKRMGIGENTHLTLASGGSFSKFSHEFQTFSEAGEDVVFVDETGSAMNEKDLLPEEEKVKAFNKEVIEEPSIVMRYGITDTSKLVQKKAIEVGNIFNLGTRFSDTLGLTYKDESGSEQTVIMGCYGIGPARVMGTIVEVLSDEKGIVWPEEVAPFQVHLVSISGGNEEVTKEADRLYDLLHENGVEVLYDDRDVRAGEKFADSDLIGIPVRLVVSEKTMSQGGIERVERSNGTTSFVSDSEVVESLRK